MNKKTALIVGAGPGLGYSLAKVFGQKGFRILLFARNEQKLKKLQHELQSEKIETCIFRADVSDQKSLDLAFDTIRKQFGIPEVMIYNAGITIPDKDIQVDADTMLRRYEVDVAGAYRCIRQMDTEEFAQKKGTLLITGGGVALHPSFSFLPLSMDKAALRAMVYALYPVLKEKGIFIGLVTIMGGIKAGTCFDPDRIAEIYWDMYQTRNQCEVLFKNREEENCD